MIEAFGGYLETVQLLATRLADLHKVTSSAEEHTLFVPEPLKFSYRRTWYQSMRNLTSRVLFQVRNYERWFSSDDQPIATDVIHNEAALYRRFRPILDRAFSAWLLRTYGDCHLGRLLRSGRDFIFLNPEDWRRSNAERERKHSGYRDVACMLYSFDFVALSALNGFSSRHGSTVGVVRTEDYEKLTAWADHWQALVRSVFIRSYRQATAESSYLAVSDQDWPILLNIYLLERALIELQEHVLDNTEEIGTALNALWRLLQDK